jgi:hypothetical protein
MLLSIRHRFLFIHIAKTGGTSIRAALGRIKWKDPWRLPMALCNRISSLSDHRIGCRLPRHARAIGAREMLPGEFYDALFKFAFVRNPWDLQVSSYHHIRRERPHLIAHCSDFASFLRWKLNPGRIYQYHIDTSIALQSSYLIDLDGNLIVDFIGRYERLAEDFHEACRRIGIESPALPHKRKGVNRRDYRCYYTDETAAMIADYFKKDIEMLDYRFEDG